MLVKIFIRDHYFSCFFLVFQSFSWFLSWLGLGRDPFLPHRQIKPTEKPGKPGKTTKHPEKTGKVLISYEDPLQGSLTRIPYKDLLWGSLIRNSYKDLLLRVLLEEIPCKDHPQGERRTFRQKEIFLLLERIKRLLFCRKRQTLLLSGQNRENLLF